MNEEFDVMNVKCGGCAANIQNGLMALTGVAAVEVEIASGHVTVSGEALSRASLEATLAELGYPIKTA